MDEFIGREKELTVIKNLVNEHDTLQVVCVHGEGGVGKTYLLQHLRRLYSNDKSYFVTPIFDFYDIRYRFARNIGNEIARLDEESFAPYKRAQQDFESLKRDPRASGQRISEKIQEVDEIYIECFNKMSAEKRVIVLADTIESVQEMDIWDNFFNKLIQLNNCVAILAGRKNDKIKQSFENKWVKKALNVKDLIADNAFGDKAIIFMPLKGFSPGETKDFFESISRKDDIKIDKEMEERLGSLTQRKPILLHLALLWLNRGFPPPMWYKFKSEELESLVEQEQKKLHLEFEAALVSDISRLEKPDETNIIRNMAFVHHRFNAEILSELTGLSIEQSEKRIEQLRNFFFIKSKAGSIIVLHDEMKRLIDEHVWEKKDPQKGERRELARRMVEYYKNKIAKEELAKVDYHSRGLYNQAIEQEEEIWQLKIEGLYYTLWYNPGEGHKKFVERFDEARKHYRIREAELLLNEAENFKAEYYLNFDNQRFELEIRRAKYETDKHKNFERSIALLEKDREQYKGKINSENKLDLLTYLAYCYKSRGNVSQSITLLEQALEICETEAKELAMYVHDNLGLAYRLSGDFEKAIEHYRQCIDNIRRTKSEDRIVKKEDYYRKLASVLNNLGYAYWLQGYLNNALSAGERALKMRKELNNDREIAMSHDTLAEIYCDLDRFYDSVEFYTRAINTFKDLGDSEWLARAKSGLGIAKWDIYRERENPEELREARQLLEGSVNIFRAIGNKIDIPVALHRLGHVYWTWAGKKGDAQFDELMNEAEKVFEESYHMSKETQNFHAEINNIVGFAELAYEKGDREEIEQRAIEVENRFEETGIRYLIYSGRIKRIQADAAYDNGDYDRAVEYYSKALTEITKHGGYGSYKISIELDKLGKRVDNLPANIAIDWCNKLRDCWSKLDLEREKINQMLDMVSVWEVNARSR